MESIFNRLRLVAIEYDSYNQTPNVRVVGEYEVSDDSEINILDSGQSIGSLTLQELRFIQNDFVPETIEVKDSNMFAGNVKYNYFSVPDEYDTRAFRFKNTNEGYVCNVYDKNNIRPIQPDFTNLPELDHECFNSFNDLDNDGGLANRYKYDPSTGELGGRGKYISYKFTTKEVLIDENIKTFDYKWGFPRILNKVSNPSENYTNPLTDVGYQRDEIYRFGIVFFDLQGRPSFTKWIGDIRFPSQDELPFITYKNYTAGVYDDGKVYANILGIEFTVDLESSGIAQELKNNISGYQIVRVKRTENDETIVAQGAFSYLGYDLNNTSTKTLQRYCFSDMPYATQCFNEKFDISERRWSIFKESISGDHPVDSAAILDPYHLEFTSPNISFNKKIQSLNKSKIELIGVLKFKRNIALCDQEIGQVTYDKYLNFLPGSWDNNNRVVQNIVTSKIYTPIERGNTGDDAIFDNCLDVLDDGVIYNNQTTNFCNDSDEDHIRYGTRGTFLMLNFDSNNSESRLAIPSDSNFIGEENNARILFGNIRINRGRNIYGGTQYENRINNEYIAASEFVNKDINTVDVYGGDTYINMFINLRGIWDNASIGKKHRSKSIICFPVESKINIDLRLDNIQKYIQWGIPEKTNSGDVVPNYALKETLTSGITNYGNIYPIEVGDLYRYNSVYSNENKAFIFHEKPFDFVPTEKIDTEIINSEKKVNGEYTDSWLKFKFNNILDVNSKYGALKRLINVNNAIYGLQERGVGKLAINERALTKDTTGATLALGTGSILERYDYMISDSGIYSYNDVCSSGNTFYYVDKNRKRFYGLSNKGKQEISIIKGLNSYFDKLNYEKIELAYDPQFNEILINIDGTIIVYSDMLKMFTSFYSYNPDKFIMTNSQLYVIKGQATDSDSYLLINNDSVALTNDNPISKVLINDTAGESYAPTLYKLNSGQPGAFFTEAGETPLSCSVTLIINPNGNIVNSFDNLDMRISVRDENNTDVPTSTINQLVAGNSYQSFLKNLVYDPENNWGSTIKKIARVWRTTLVESTAYTANLKRLVDTYVLVKLTYNSSGDNAGYSFKIHDIITYYRPRSI